MSTPRAVVLDGGWIVEIDAWLDSVVGETVTSQAQDWARVAKIAEEVGEAVEAMMALTGQNPRKPKRDEAYVELMNELADTAITAIIAIHHFTKDSEETAQRFADRVEFLYRRMRSAIADAGWAA